MSAKPHLNITVSNSHGCYASSKYFNALLLSIKTILMAAKPVKNIMISKSYLYLVYAHKGLDLV
jgi:hypothetical protein